MQDVSASTVVTLVDRVGEGAGGGLAGRVAGVLDVGAVLVHRAAVVVVHHEDAADAETGLDLKK